MVEARVCEPKRGERVPRSESKVGWGDGADAEPGVVLVFLSEAHLSVEKEEDEVL